MKKNTNLIKNTDPAVLAILWRKAGCEPFTAELRRQLLAAGVPATILAIVAGHDPKNVYYSPERKSVLVDMPPANNRPCVLEITRSGVNIHIKEQDDDGILLDVHADTGAAE